MGRAFGALCCVNWLYLACGIEQERCFDLFQCVDARGVCAEDFFAVFRSEVCEVVAEGLPPVGVGGRYEADGPV